MKETTKTRAVSECGREVVYSAFFLGVAAGALLAFALSVLALP